MTSIEKRGEGGKGARKEEWKMEKKIGTIIGCIIRITTARAGRWAVRDISLES